MVSTTLVGIWEWWVLHQVFGCGDRGGLSKNLYFCGVRMETLKIILSCKNCSGGNTVIRVTFT